MQTRTPARPHDNRSAVALLAVSGYIALLSMVFMTPFLLSARAQQNDVFMANLLLSPILYVIGSTAVIAGLHALGLRRSLTGLLALGNLAVLVLAAWLIGSISQNGIRALAIGILVSAGMLLVVSTVVVGGLHTWGIGGGAAVLALCGAAVVSLGYMLFGSRYYAFGETASSLPPYLDAAVLGLSVVGGLAILVLVRWSNQPRAGG